MSRVIDAKCRVLVEMRGDGICRLGDVAGRATPHQIRLSACAPLPAWVHLPHSVDVNAPPVPVASDLLAPAREEATRAIVSGRPGRDVAREFGRAVDAAVIKLLAPIPGADALEVVRLGGWARGDLCPRADVDAWLFLPAENAPLREKAEAAAGELLRSLWDGGIRVSHVVGSADEILSEARADHTRATSLLEAVPLSTGLNAGEGAADALKRFRTRVIPAMRRKFVREKLKEADDRRARFGGRVHLTEPDVKYSPGAVRDLHLLLWIGLAIKPVPTSGDALARLLSVGLIFPREVDQLRLAWDDLTTLRIGLHLATGRPENRLAYEYQNPAAEQLGVKATANETQSEAMMRQYFVAALAIRGTVKDALDRLLDELFPPPRGVRVALEPGIYARSGRIHVDSRRREGAGWMIDVVRVAGEEGLMLAPHTRSIIRKLVADAAPEQWVNDLDAGAAIARLCRSTRTIGSPFLMLLELGVLPLVLRDFSRLAGRFKADGYHTTTTDGHIVHAIDNALQAVSGAMEPPAPIAEAVARTPAQHLVVYGALFHDLGKGLPGDHSHSGLTIVEREAGRLRLTPNETRTVQFLVAEHLTLSHASQRRDLADPAVVEDLCARIRTEDRARLLTMLTWVDIAAVSPGMLTDWKARLLGMAVERVVTALQGDQGTATKAMLDAEVRAASRAALLPNSALANTNAASTESILDEATIDVFIGGASRRFLASRHEHALLGDATAFAAFVDANRTPVVTSSIAEGGRAHVVRVVAPDRHRLLADYCGAIASEGGNLLHAHVDTRADGVAFDAFRVDNGRHAALPQLSIEHVVAALNDVAHGRREGIPRLIRPRQGPSVAAQVRILDGRDSFGARVVEVRARDRPGLLASLSAAIAQSGAEVELALVTTDGAVARDTFYIQTDIEAFQAEPLKRALLIAAQ